MVLKASSNHLRPSSSQKAMTSTGPRSSGGAPDSCRTCKDMTEIYQVKAGLQVSMTLDLPVKP
jgi:hypothetical protein